MNSELSKQTLLRLPLYLSYLKALPETVRHISATAIARELALGHVQVRKDLACVSSAGRPRVGYERQSLIREIEHFLGYDDTHSAVLVGAGRLGMALYHYDGFRHYGMHIVAAFDSDPAVQTMTGEHPVLGMEKLSDMCRRLSVRIGIITVPAAHAQAVCDALVAAGALAIWNFAPVRLVVPEGILVQNENMASSLAVLSKHMRQQIMAESKEMEA